MISLLIVLLSECTSHSTRDMAQKEAVISTPKGDIVFRFYEETPQHNAMFQQLAQKRYYDDYTFNRVITDFVIQGGCPDTPEGFADSPYLLKPEYHPKLKHVYGAVGMGRDNNPDKLSNGCQFYIVNTHRDLSRLDQNYVIFGYVVEGFDVLDAISQMPVDENDQPLETISLSISIR